MLSHAHAADSKQLSFMSVEGQVDQLIPDCGQKFDEMTIGVDHGVRKRRAYAFELGEVG